MKKYLIALTALILMSPSFVFSDIVSFKVGYFIPRAQSDLWEIEFDNMSFSKSNFQNTNFGFNYEYFLLRELSLVLCVDGYTKQKSGFYNDYYAFQDEEGDFYAFIDEPEGDVIPHVFSVSVTPIQLGIKFTPLGRKSKLIPYIGGGVGVYLWNVRLQGEMIDFSQWVEFIDGTIGHPIYSTDAREENKFTVGYHVFGGFMMPVANRISIEAEFKYNFITGNFTEAFEGFDPFDLNSYQVSLGLNYWF